MGAHSARRKDGIKVSDSFQLSGIALGTIVAIAAYHLARAFAHQDLKDRADGTGIIVGRAGNERVDDEGASGRLDRS